MAKFIMASGDKNFLNASTKGRRYKVVDVQLPDTAENRALNARIEAFEELDKYMYILERCDFDRGVTGALLENPVTLLENIKRCVVSKCSTEMTRTILLEGLM